MEDNAHTTIEQYKKPIGLDGPVIIIGKDGTVNIIRKNPIEKIINYNKQDKEK